MKFSLSTVICFLGLFTTVQAQKIGGRATLADGKPAEFATVVLHKALDSTVVKGTLTDTEGAFEFVRPEVSRYYLVITVVGAGKTMVSAFDYAGGDYTIPPVQLKPAANEIGTVTVTARKPLIEVQADKTIVNVEGTVNSTGLSALELLRKSPGVTVDNNENVSIRGKNGVRIMIDGREVPLDGRDLAAILKGMQASDIASIEIISNPSAKYDAAGNAGIINIKMRRNKALGTNGNINLEATQGITPKGGGGLSLNHRTKQVSLFGTYNANYGRWHNTNDFFREQNGLTFDQQANSYWMSRYNRIRTGADWMINDKHTIGVLVNGSINNGSSFTNSQTNIGNISNRDLTDSLLLATNDAIDERADLNVNFNYRFADTMGHSFNMDIDRGGYRIRGDSRQPNFYRSADESREINRRIYRTLTPTDIIITTAKADYEQRLWKGKLGVGAKVADVQTDNTFGFYQVVDNREVKDKKASNQFIYKERTSAGYVNYNRAFGKLNVQGGLRLEHTDFSGNLIAENGQNVPPVQSSYTELFPSAALTYPFTKDIGINLTYSRRIDRPSYQDLNPFEFRLDELTYQKGNPRLRPQFTHSIELSPTYKGQPAMTLGYSRTRDVFTQILDTTNIRAAFITQANLADQENYSATLNIPVPLAKWWEGFISITGYHSRFSAKFREDFVVEQSFQAFNLYSEQTVRLPKGFSVQLSGWYNSRAFWGTLRNEPQGAMDLGFQKKLFNGKGEVRLRFGDILRTAAWKGENLFSPGLLMTARGTWESRTTTLNFSYRFGSAEVKGIRQRKTGLEEEGNRVKGRN
jgi:iron complex outermembrane recepter protein